MAKESTYISYGFCDPGKNNVRTNAHYEKEWQNIPLGHKDCFELNALKKWQVEEDALTSPSPALPAHSS